MLVTRIRSMRVLTRTAATAAIAAALLASATAGALARPQDDAFAKLPWARGTQHLDASHANFVVPPGSRMVTGLNAAAADNAVNGTTDADSEGVVAFGSGGILYMKYVDAGYVKTDDFTKVDPQKMLDDMKSATADENEERKKNGSKELFVDGWLQKPTLSKATNTVRYVVSLHTEAGPLINATALKLGRHGYERFVYATSPSNAASTSKTLDALTGDFTYDRGSQFSDYVTGDKVAEYGIAGLIATTAGVAIAKTVGFGAVLLLIKKFFVFVVLFFGAILGRFRKMFAGRKKLPPSMPTSSPFTNPEPPAV